MTRFLTIPLLGRTASCGIRPGDPHTLIEYKGKIWFTVQRANRYGWYDPGSRQTKIFTVPTEKARPYGIVSAKSGLFVALWRADRQHSQSPLARAQRHAPHRTH